MKNTIKLFIVTLAAGFSAFSAPSLDAVVANLSTNYGKIETFFGRADIIQCS